MSFTKIYLSIIQRFTCSYKASSVSSEEKLNQLNILANHIDGLVLGDKAWDMPLELLIHQLIYQLNGINIKLIVASTAGISCSRLYNELTYNVAFGVNLLKDCLEPNDLEKESARTNDE